jgi:hypothetical protein
MQRVEEEADEVEDSKDEALLAAIQMHLECALCAAEQQRSTEGA